MKARVAMRLPDFFIAGGVKCGSTSLYRYLGQHPDVYMPRVKEPGFFVYEGRRGPLPVKGATATLQEYSALYADVPRGVIAGDASPIYLYHSRTAAPRLRELVPEARLIVSLRNPIQRAFAQYRMAVAEGMEDARDFEAALDAESERVERGEPMIYHYMRQGLYYEDVKRYMETFGPDRVHIHLFDDFQRDPLAVVEELFDFLGVDGAFVPKLHARYNASRGIKHRRFDRLLRQPGLLKNALGRVLPVRTRRRIKARLMGLNIEPHRMSESARLRLAAAYREDLRKLSSLLDRDLSTWLD